MKNTNLGDYDEFGVDVMTAAANNYPMDGGQTNPWATATNWQYGAADSEGAYSYDVYTPAQASAAAAGIAMDAAASGKPVPSSVAMQMQSWGVPLSNIVGAAGAIYKLTQTAQGTYTAAPVNQNAQNAIAQAQASKNTMMLALAGFAGILALKFLK